MAERRPVTDAEWQHLEAALTVTRSKAAEPRRPADPIREEMVGRWRAEGLSPEEWVARHAQDMVSFSGDQFRYADPATDEWVQRLGAILFTSGGVELCRRRFLTDEEHRAAIERENEPL